MPISGRDGVTGKFLKGRKGTTRTKDAARAARSLSMAIRQRLDPEVFIEFQLIIAMGKSPVLIETDDGDIRVMVEERAGLVPSIEQRIQAMIRLEQRGHGMPVQQLQLDAEVRQHNALPAAIQPQLTDMALVVELARVLEQAERAALPAGHAPGPASMAPVIDVESTATGQPERNGMSENGITTTATGQHPNG